VALAAGVSTWASGHYRSQRRFRLADQEEERGSAFPRFFSLRTIGDVGVEKNIEKVFNSPSREFVLTKTVASTILLSALANDQKVSDVPEWAYTQGNIKAGAAHYYEVCAKLDSFLHSNEPAARINVIQQWLERACSLTSKLAELGLEKGSHTDIVHQQIWLNAFNKWRKHSGLCLSVKQDRVLCGFRSGNQPRCRSRVLNVRVTDKF
jgi:hypothetical protein